MSAVTVLGYSQRCANCGVAALLAEQTPGWTCPDCTGYVDPDDDPMGRAYALVTEFLIALRRLGFPVPEGAMLDTVEALDDGDPEAGQLGPEAAAEAVAGWHQAGFIDESSPAQQTPNTELRDAE